ncbi:MAG: biopolymer transporter ExbD [Candidatus Omnitrophota bacterium]
MEIKRKIVKTNLQIAPLIDIIFNLLLFFMLSYQLGAVSGIKVTLPSAKTAQAQKQKDIIISITENNKIFLSEKETSMEKLKDALEEELKHAARKTVIIRADDKINLGLAVKVMDIAKQAEAEGVVISTKTDETKMSPSP